MVSLKEMFARVADYKRMLYAVQGIVCVIALSFWTWDAVTVVKARTLERINYDLYPWTYYYFHPAGSDLLNYVFVCIMLGIIAGLFYCLSGTNLFTAINKKINTVHPAVVSVSTLLSLLVLRSFILSDSFVLRSGLFVLLISLPLLSFSFSYAIQGSTAEKRKSRAPLVVSAVLFLLVILEPMRTILGPVYLINDYADIYGRVKVEGSYVDNKHFLEKMKSGYMDTVKRYLALVDEIDIAMRVAESIPEITKGVYQQIISTDEFGLFNAFRDKDLRLGQNYFKLLLDNPSDAKRWESRFNSLSGGSDQKIDYIDNVKKIDIEAFKEFYLDNYTEYWLQNMGRGQIHHIGHLLNPINEYELGKPVTSLYLQYGIGDTLFTKWTMDLFGGLSIQNFYKTYVYYVLYALLFLVMTFVLFKDYLYASVAFSILPGCFFLLGYFAYILAPGFIPLVHIMDVVAIMLLIIFLRKGRLVYLVLLGVAGVLSIFINRQFGLALYVSLFISLLLYVRENGEGKRWYFWSVCALAAAVVGVLSMKVFSAGIQDQITKYFLLGWLSWPVGNWKIGCAILYLVISYLFIFMLSSYRNYLKYVYVAIFLYAQMLLVYYFWSGLVNHIPTVLPFVWLQFILMLYISEKELVKGKVVLKNVVRLSAKLSLVLSVVFILRAGVGFYKQKALFSGNFINHRVYKWEFPRARVISTINPSLITDSINLIHKYSQNDSRIFIISKYDGLLPFVARRYSGMRFFELGSFLFSKKESTSAIRVILDRKPEYIFVDSDILQTSDDPWEKVYQSDYTDRERVSRLARYARLKDIFLAIKGDYEKVDGGPLISVYKRRPTVLLGMKKF